jgi:hypothetical protein
LSRREYRATPEAEARLLLLIERFSRHSALLEGRTKLAKLDFLLRYPKYLRRALAVRTPNTAGLLPASVPADIESRMVRYRYGPWDPAYFALLGSLVGRGLVEEAPYKHGIGYRATAGGRDLTAAIRAEAPWESVGRSVDLLHRHLNLSGSGLKRFVYEIFPEVTQASWGQRL